MSFRGYVSDWTNRKKLESKNFSNSAQYSICLRFSKAPNLQGLGNPEQLQIHVQWISTVCTST